MAQKATRITTDSATPIASINDRLEDTTRARASLPIQETLAELVPKMPAGPVAHAEIRKRVLEEINKQRWTPPSKIEAKVEDGTVAAPPQSLAEPTQPERIRRVCDLDQRGGTERARGLGASPATPQRSRASPFSSSRSARASRIEGSAGRVWRELVRTGASLPLHFLDHRGYTTPCRGADLVALFLEDDCSRRGVRGGVLSQFVDHKHGSLADAGLAAQVRFVVSRIWVHISFPGHRPVRGISAKKAAYIVAR